MSKKIKYPTGFNPADKKAMADVLYATIQEDGDERYLNTHNAREDAADDGEGGEVGVYVATYRLVKIECLRLKRTTEVVPA